MALSCAIALAGFVGYQSRGIKPAVAPQTESIATERRPKITANTGYSIIEEVIGYGGSRRTVEVRLNAKVSEQVLREIAHQIKAAETTPYEDRRMWFYLPGHGPDKGPGYRHAWARVFFDPDNEPDSAIMGLTIEEERLLLAEPLVLPPGCKPIGSWLCEEWKCRTTICQIGDEWFLQSAHPGSNQQLVEELEHITSSAKMEFTRGSMRYSVDSEGILYAYSDDIVRTAKPIKLSPRGEASGQQQPGSF